MKKEELKKEIVEATMTLFSRNHVSATEGMELWFEALLSTAAIVGDALGQNPKEFVLSLLEQAQAQVKSQL